MRKIYAILMTAVMTLAASVSCIKEAEFPEENPSATGEVTFEITVPDMMPETKAMKSGWTSGDKFPATPEYVDLGLSVKWATFNVGARSAEDYGGYYAWGETETKSDYSWSTYFDNPSGDGNTFTKYNVNGGKTVLDPENDVAHVKWGGNWRMPTDFFIEVQSLFFCV